MQTPSTVGLSAARSIPAPDIGSAPLADTLTALRVDPETGLSRTDADARRREHGYNEVATTREHPVRRVLFAGALASQDANRDPIDMAFLAAAHDHHMFDGAKAVRPISFQLCVVKAAILARVPSGLDLIEAAALPLVTTTGNQLLLATEIKGGQTVLVAGAAGNVGRSAVFTAKERGATVIAGVLKRQIDDAKTVGADLVVATDDNAAIASLPPLDAVADAVGGRTGEKLIARVRPRGVYASLSGQSRTPRSTHL